MIRSPEELAAKRQACVARSRHLRETMQEDLAALSSPLDKATPLLRYAPIALGVGTALLVWKRPRSLLNTGRKLISLWQYCIPVITLIKNIRAEKRDTDTRK